MKKILLFLLLAPGAVAQSPTAGKVVEGLSVNSAVLGKPVRYCLYLPPDYATSQRRYPVVYLLHGYTDNETGWLQFGEANRLLDRAIAAGEVPPMVLVMPDAGVSWYINDYQGKVRYEDMFLNELIPHVDSTYRTRPTREFRGVAGLSMGGYGSLILAMHHPDRFAACAALSAAIFSDEAMVATADDRYNAVFASLFSGAVKGKARLTDTWYRNSPLQLAKTLPEADLNKVRYYFDCGDDDFLAEGNALMHIQLSRRKVAHEFRVRDGAHTWSYWRTGLPDALRFIAQSFSR